MIAALYNHSIELHDKRLVLWQLVRQQLILRYRRTALGYLWTLLNPLLMMTVSSIVFANLFQADLKTFVIYLFAGMIPWNCFNSIVVQSGSSFISNESLIKKIYLPKVIFPLSTALGLLIDSALSFIALFIIALAVGAQMSWALLFLPIAYAMLFFFSLGFALVASILVVFFRDMQHVIVVVMQAWFYLTPIMYKREALMGKAAWLMTINPLVPFITMFRDPICSGTCPELTVVTQAFFLACASMTLGLALFLNQEKKVVFRL
ncbi:MAG: ABC transporter permease [Planctomycetia bacterium]|nr:ABC transporter permease [Planctomycetia bacterium]